METELTEQINNADYTILIVDDVMSNVLLLKVLLTNEKFKVITASNGEMCIKQAKEQQPDLILLDVMMPGMTGFETAEKLKADPTTKQIPIIFLTALNAAADVVRGFKSGGNDFISKPFNKEELIIRVSHQISLVAAKRIILDKTEQLTRTITGRDKLYSVIAHDLRSPLSSIKMVLNMLVMTLPAEMIGEDMYQMLNMANQGTEDLFGLLDNLLKWTKSQIGKLNVVYQDFDVTETISGVIDIFGLVSSMKNIKIVFDPHEEIMVHADADMMKTIIRNFLSNALKFSYDGSEIHVLAYKQDDMAVIAVRDHGQGMSEEDQQKLLKTETHFSKYGTNNEEGSGLGLLLCLDFAQKNGGRMWIESKKDEGSTFYFSVPLIKES
jgi:two-component system sensor histidine kinase/response regulator